MNTKNYISVLLLCTTYSVPAMDWEIIRIAALAHAQNRYNPAIHTMSIPQGSYFFVDPCKVKNIFNTNYLFDLKKEKEIIQNTIIKDSLEDFIPHIQHQIKLALFIVECTEERYLNSLYQFTPFQQNKTLNWSTRLLYSLDLLEKPSTCNAKHIVFGLETITRFFSQKNTTSHIFPQKHILKPQKIKKRLKENITQAEKLLGALLNKKRTDIDQIRAENSNNYITVFGLKECLTGYRPLNNELFNLISSINGNREMFPQVTHYIRKKYGVYTNVFFKQQLKSKWVKKNSHSA